MIVFTCAVCSNLEQFVKFFLTLETPIIPLNLGEDNEGTLLETLFQYSVSMCLFLSFCSFGVCPCLVWTEQYCYAIIHLSYILVCEPTHIAKYSGFCPRIDEFY